MFNTPAAALRELFERGAVRSPRNATSAGYQLSGPVAWRHAWRRLRHDPTMAVSRGPSEVVGAHHKPVGRHHLAAGIGPNRAATLELRGHKSGRTISFPVVVADYQGERYLVAMLGQKTN